MRPILAEKRIEAAVNGGLADRDLMPGQAADEAARRHGFNWLG